MGGAKLSKSRFSDTLSAVKADERLTPSMAVDEGDAGIVATGGVERGEHKRGTARKTLVRWVVLGFIGMLSTCTSIAERVEVVDWFK